MKELITIQSKLKAPKGQFNKFGNYRYRSCEDILEAVKPIISENNCTLVISDEIVCIGDRFYVKATATLKNVETNETEFSVAFAREEDRKKGMDGSQLTGTASSYARKYALNGLFCIDDTKDADALPPSQNKPTDELVLAIKQVNESSNEISLKEVWDNHPNLHNNGVFRKAVNDKKKAVAA